MSEPMTAQVTTAVASLAKPALRRRYTVSRASDLMGLWGVCFAIYGPPGCLAGETPLRIRRNNHLRTVTLEQEHRRLHGIPGGYGWHRRDANVGTLLQSMEADSTVTWKSVHDIVASGTKPIYALAVSGRPPVHATAEHRFMTPDGYCRLSDLRKGSTLVVQGRLIKPPLTVRPYRREVTAFFHPNASYKMVGEYGPYGRIKYARAVLEAHMNNLTVEQFLHIVNNDLRRALDLNFLPAESEVHHADEDSANDVPENLYALTKVEHARLHGEQNKRNFGQGRWATETAHVLDIVPLGDKMTYDVQMDDETAPNFLVNGIVTHNSGKSTLAAQAAHSQWAGKVGVIDAEGGARAYGDHEDIDVFSIKDSDANHDSGMGYSAIEAILDDLIAGTLVPADGGTYGTIIVDNASEVNADCMYDTMRTVPRNIDRKDRPDQKDWNTTTSRMLLLVRRFRDFAQASGTNVIFIAWDRLQDDRVTGISKKDMAFNPALASQFPGLLDMVGYLTIGGKGKRTLSFEASATTAAKFRRAPNEVAMTIPGEFEYNFGDKNLPFADLLNTLKGGVPFPQGRYKLVGSAAPAKQGALSGADAVAAAIRGA